MGHTLVAVFQDSLNRTLDAALTGLPANKIPFGRDCDRAQANRILPYHATLVHWGKASDAALLSRTMALRMQPCAVKVTGAALWDAEEFSSLLCLTAEPGAGFSALRRAITEKTGLTVPEALHITVSVSRDRDLTQQQHRALTKALHFPLTLPVRALALYHIWEPVCLVKEIAPEENTV